MTREERNLLARRMLLLCHHVLVDIRTWIYEGEIQKAQDVADNLEALEIEFFGSWLTTDKEKIYYEIHERIDWFVKKYNDRKYYHEIFDHSFEEFVEKYIGLEYVERRDIHKEY